MADQSVDVFISYAHQDREWAEKLALDLGKRGVTVFFDQKSLRAGEKWEAPVVEAVQTCKNLVCFWSSFALGSAWVQHELAMYRVSKRNPIIVSLDATTHAFGSVQAAGRPVLQTAYGSGGVKQLSAAEWDQFVEEIVTTQRLAPDIRIPVAVLTMEESSLKNFSDRDRQQIEAQLFVKPADLLTRYGAQRLDWKPFLGDATSIGTYLKDTRTMLNSWLKTNHVAESIGWLFPEDRFWTDDEYASTFAAGMEGEEPGLIIIDPVAALDDDVRSRLGLFERSLRLPRVAIVALYPSGATAQNMSFRRWVERYADSLLRPYIAPHPRPAMALGARLGLGVDDIGEMRRLLKTGIGEHLRRQQPAESAAESLNN